MPVSKSAKAFTSRSLVLEFKKERTHDALKSAKGIKVRGDEV